MGSNNQAEGALAFGVNGLGPKRRGQELLVLQHNLRYSIPQRRFAARLRLAYRGHELKQATRRYHSLPAQRSHMDWPRRRVLRGRAQLQATACPRHRLDKAVAFWGVVLSLVLHKRRRSATQCAGWRGVSHERWPANQRMRYNGCDSEG